MLDGSVRSITFDLIPFDGGCFERDFSKSITVTFHPSAYALFASSRPMPPAPPTNTRSSIFINPLK